MPCRWRSRTSCRRCSRTRPSAGRSTTRGVLYTAMGAWATGTAQVFLNDSAGTDGGAAGTAVFARGGTGALADALEASAAGLGVEVRTGAEVVAIRTAATVAPSASGSRTAPRSTRRSSSRPPTRSARCGCSIRWPWARRRCGAAENIRQPGATARVNFALVGSAGVRRRRDEERLRGRIVIGPSIDAVEQRDGRREVRARQRGADAGGDDPVARRPVARSRGQARDERRVPGGAAAAARRGLDRRARPGRRHRREDAGGVRARVRRARRGARGDHARGHGDGLRPHRRGRPARRARRSISSSRGARCSARRGTAS